jgi:hypothetical protein
MQPTEPALKPKRKPSMGHAPFRASRAQIAFATVNACRRSPQHCDCPLIVLALSRASRLDTVWTGGPTMQPREATPIWVGLTFALMIVGTILYLTGYFMIEDILAYFK